LARWRDQQTNRVRSRSFARVEDAKAFGARADQQPPAGTADGTVSLGDYIERMIRDDWNLRGSTRYGYHCTLERHIARGIGRRPIAEISTQELRGFFASLNLGMAGKAGVYRLLAKAFNQAVGEGVLDRSPLKSIPRPKAVRREIVPLVPAQIDALACRADPRYRAAILLAAWAGLRAGEVGGLRVQDVDVSRRSLRITQAVRTEGGRRMLGEVKTPSGRRTVAIPEFLATELKRHMDRFSPMSDGRIFSTDVGGLVCHVVLLKRLHSAARRAGIVPAPRFHDLRHSAAAIMIEQGAHPKLIQAQLGHANISITLDIYGHLFPSLAEEMAAKLDTVFRSALEPSSKAVALPDGLPDARRPT
jgi:integrase